jgi:hypothetical protein
MESDLFSAILSMDAYNRDYGAGINLGSGTTQIGNATITQDSSILVDGNGDRLDQPASFYAIAYNWNGQTVISYRGTDDWDPYTGDPIAGFFQHVGLGFSQQSTIAVEFFNSVIGSGTDPRNSGVALTGHSLGGGLAGYVAGLHGLQANIFDHMAFEAAF